MTADPHNLTRTQVIALLEEVDTLREEVRQLREELCPTIIYPAAWGLVFRQATALSCIMAASPQPCHRERIFGALYAGEDEPETGLKAVDGHICHIRRKLRTAAPYITFDSIWGVGYLMPAQVRDRLLSDVEEYRLSGLRTCQIEGLAA